MASRDTFLASAADDRDDVIAHYYNQGLTGEEIRNMLSLHHQISVSLRHLRRVLAQLGLQRRQYSNETDIRRCIKIEIDGSGSGLGYRAMKLRLEQKYNLHTTRKRVMELLQEMDPLGVELRKRHCLRRRCYYNKGPNYMVHVDGYDKIKPYGFAIHGAIDGYSRRILWLRVGASNNDPFVVASYFMDYVQSIEGVPRVLRVDAGSENTIISKMQKAFRWNANDHWSQHKSVIVGSSKNNQRIERWWGILRRQAIQYWINLFKDMEQLGLLSRDNGIEKEMLRFCLMRIIQRELDIVMKEWNLHRIRPSRNLETVPGKPNTLYYMPALHGTRDYKTEVDMHDVEAIRCDYCRPPTTYGCSDHVANAVLLYMQEERLAQPVCRQEALELYGLIYDNKNTIQEYSRNYESN